VSSHRPSASVIISLIALVFAFAGGALAAKRYLITSTHQISPNALKALRATVYQAFTNNAGVRRQAAQDVHSRRRTVASTAWV
jgi:hypothetical protein